MSGKNLAEARPIAINSASLVPFSGFCYYKQTHGTCFPKPVLLLPVEHLRRVSPLVSDLHAQMIQKTHP
jgi:hypothetical protein